MSVVVGAPGRLSPGRILAPAAAALAGVVLVLMLSLAMSGGTTQAPSAQTVSGVSDYALKTIPPSYLTLYQSAAQTFGIDWAILAGIGFVETDHGRLRAAGVTSGANFLGCCGGPMQFYFVPGPGRLAAAATNATTWGKYAVDGDGDGYKDVWDPADAIPAAAKYLVASGAPGDYNTAILAYNHAQWYVDEVMDAATKYRGSSTTVITTAGAQPLPALGAPVDPGNRLSAAVAAMNKLEAARLPYCYGGGHGITPAAPSGGQYCWGGRPLHKIYGGTDVGLDCSSSVSWVLQAAGYALPTMTSGMFNSWGAPGPGKSVTIWANAEHVFMQVNIAGRAYFWGTAYENYRHGPGWTSPHPTAAFIATHPEGL